MESETEVPICYYCQRMYSSLMEFHNCNHKICVTCMFQTIFINNIQDLKGNNIIKVNCKCGKGNMDQTLNDIISIIIQKSELDEMNKGETKDDADEIELDRCKIHPNSYLNNYCIECNRHICKECQSAKTNEHHFHRVVQCRKLKKHIQKSINFNLYLYYDDNTFKIFCDEVAAKIQTEIEKNLNESLQKIDSLIKTVCEFRQDYIKNYYNQLQNIIKTFKIIKFYYMNYYKDHKMAKEGQCKNINFLRYVNNINYEFRGIQIQHNEEAQKKFLEIKQLLTQLKKGDIKLVNSNFIFNETNREYLVEELINNVHSNFITGIAELNNERLLTSCRKELLMKIYQEEEDKGFVEKAQIKGECGCLLYLENENKIISGDRTGTISIYKESDKIPNKYEKIQTLSHHDKQINSLAKIPGNKIVSVGFDCRIIIWKQSEHNRDFNPAQIITIDKPIAVVISLFDSRIVFTCNDGPIHIYKENDSLENIQYEKCEYIEEQILNDESKGNKQHRGRVSCLCQLNNSYIISGGADKYEKVEDNNKNKKEHFIVVWRPENEKYICSQILKDHKASLTCIIQLRDGNFASSSYDRTVKIWKPVKNENNIYMYTLLYDLTDYNHGIHMLIQLKDDRLCGTSSKNQIVLWRNRSGSY